MSVANWLSAFSTLGPASLAGALSIYAVYRIAVTGLQSMSQPALALPDRRLIGKYVLALVAAVIALAVLLVFFQREASGSARTISASSGTQQSQASPSVLSANAPGNPK